MTTEHEAYDYCEPCGVEKNCCPCCLDELQNRPWTHCLNCRAPGPQAHPDDGIVSADYCPVCRDREDVLLVDDTL